MKKISLPKGTKDIFTPDIKKWQYLEAKIREFYHRFMYQEVRTPLFEHSELFQRGIGDTTEVVSKEMYTFLDRGNRSLTLRPENTASLVRAAIENNLFENVYPLRFYYIGPMFRYDKPQKGRYRQFHQFGIEIFADSTPQVDAELIYSGDAFLREIGLQELKIYLNSVGCRACRPGYLKILQNTARRSQSDLCADCREKIERNPLRIFDCKIPGCQQAAEGFPRITDALCDDCDRHFRGVKEGLENLGVQYSLNSKLVRGLDYYTKTAFEIVSDKLGAQDALLGGGRYDDLVKELGGPDIPATGFAAGMERIILHLDQIEEKESARIFIAYQDAKFLNTALQTAKRFWQEGHTAYLDYGGKNIGKQMKKSNRLKADYTIILGEDEVNNNKISIKNMQTREQIQINTKDLEEWQKTNL